VNIGCHPDPAVGRELISGGVAAFAHFSSMPGSTGAGLRDDDRAVAAEVGRRYDSRVHLRNQADHTAALTPAFVDRFAVVGPPEVCVERLRELAHLGIDRFIITGATFGADPELARDADRLVTREVVPALREGAPV
jgi:5,10-methylenetetrahydromethanopterin reductase